MLDCGNDGGDEPIGNYTNLFPRLTCVTNMGTMLVFFVDKNIFMIKLQNPQVFMNVLVISYYQIETYFSPIILN